MKLHRKVKNANPKKRLHKKAEGMEGFDWKEGRMEGMEEGFPRNLPVFQSCKQTKRFGVNPIQFQMGL